MNKKWLIAILILVLVCAAAAGMMLYKSASKTDTASQPVQTAPPYDTPPTATKPPEPIESPASTEPPEEEEIEIDPNLDEAALGEIVVGEEFVIELDDEYSVAGG